jgi:TetR/AcrR family transcriptional repressor of bet genes
MQPPAKPDRKTDLAAAALRCLARDGYASLTARKIAAEAGLSLGHITYHYDTMDSLLAAAYALASDQLRRSTTQHLAQQATPLARLDAFLRAGFTPEFLTPAHLRMRIDLWSAALSHPAIAETEAALYSRYRAELMGHLTALAAPDRDPAPVADMIMATLDGLWLDYIRRGDAQAVDNALTACLTYAKSALT